MATMFSSGKSMPLDPRRSIPVYRAAFRAAMLCLRLGVLASTALLVGIAAARFSDFCSGLAGLKAAVFGYLKREEVLVAIHFITIAVLSILSRRRIRESSEAPTSEGHPAAWFRATSSSSFPPDATPDSSFQAAAAASTPSAPPEETCGSFGMAEERRSPKAAGFSSTDFRKPSEVRSSGASGKATCSVSGGLHPGRSSTAARRASPPHERNSDGRRAPKRVCPGNAGLSSSSWSPRSTSPTVVGKPSASPMRNWESVEATAYSAGWPHGFSPAPPTAPSAPPAPPEEKNCESMDATWESIAHGRRLSKNNTWGPPARVPLERSRDAAVGARLMKSETFQETSSSSAGARSARPSPLSPKTQGRVVAVPEDLDEMDRRCEAFINKVRARMNLERQESFRRRCQDISARLNDSVSHPLSSRWPGKDLQNISTNY